jgi:hypothetical protein
VNEDSGTYFQDANARRLGLRDAGEEGKERGYGGAA